jgi:hypothetical protein
MTDFDVEPLRPKPANWRPARMRMIEFPQIIWLGSFERIETDHSPLRAMVSVDFYSTHPEYPLAGDWLHISVSRARRLPTWGDLCKTRDELGFADRPFVQLVPPTSHWLNIAGHCLHLWSRIDGDTVPRILWDQEGADGRFYGKRAGLDGK